MELISQMGIIPMTVLHIAGVVLGLGIATGLDLWLMQSVFRQVIFSQRQLDNILFLSKLTGFALLGLWVSGLGFLVFYEVNTPEKLLNPKIWSKLFIVAVLSLNGFIIHRWVMPKLQSCVGAPLITSLSYQSMATFFVCGAVSVVSWYFPLIYGLFPVLNFAYSLGEFMLAYLAVIVIAVLTSLALLGFIHARYTYRFSNRQNRLIKNLLAQMDVA